MINISEVITIIGRINAVVALAAVCVIIFTAREEFLLINSIYDKFIKYEYIELLIFFWRSKAILFFLFTEYMKSNVLIKYTSTNNNKVRVI